MLRVLVLLVLFATAHAWGQIAAPDVTVAQLDAAEKSVSASLPADDPQRVSLLKSYADTRAALISFEQFNEQLKELRAVPVQCPEGGRGDREKTGRTP